MSIINTLSELKYSTAMLEIDKLPYETFIEITDKEIKNIQKKHILYEQLWPCI